MGLLKFLTKPEPATLVRLSAGSFTVDRSGRTLVSTLPSSFPAKYVTEIGRAVQAAFKKARETELAVGELVIRYPTLKIVARELRGGAIIFLVPIKLGSPTHPVTRI
jgi:hypothetical protein